MKTEIDGNMEEIKMKPDEELLKEFSIFIHREKSTEITVLSRYNSIEVDTKTACFMTNIASICELLYLRMDGLRFSYPIAQI